MPMEDLHKILGNSYFISKISHEILSRSFRSAIIQGPSGSGKTEILNSISKNIVKNINCLWIRGQDSKFLGENGPLMPAINRGKAATKDMLSLINASVDDFLPRGKNLAKAIASIIFNKNQEYTFHDPVQSEFTSLIILSIKSKDTLIIVDDVQYLDKKTCDYVYKIYSLSQQNHPLLKKLMFLFAKNTDVADAENTLIRNIICPMTYSTSYCKKNDFYNVLASLGLKKAIPNNIIDLLYDCSGGHLHVAKCIAIELNSIATAECEAVMLPENIISYVLEKRINDAGQSACNLSKMLSCAAAVGMSFSEKEILCIFGSSISAAEIINTAQQIGLLIEEDGVIRFSHDLIYNYFCNTDRVSMGLYYKKYNQCLKILRPGDYISRHRASLKSLDMDYALTMQCMALIAEWRIGNQSTNHHRENPNNNDEKLFHISDYLEKMQASYKYLFAGNDRLALDLAQSIHEAYPDPLIAERDYLISECLLKDLTIESSSKAKDILSGWGGLQENEPELWCRMRLLLLLAHTQLSDHDGAIAVEKSLISFLSKRVGFDKYSRRQLNHLLALSDMYHAPEIASQRIIQACSFYEKQILSSGHTDVYEYYICLTNASGNLVLAGDFGASLQKASKAIRLVRDYQLLNFPAQWAPMNNFIISMILSGKSPPKDGCAALRKVIKSHAHCDDINILRNNLACSLALIGDYCESIKVLSRNLSSMSLKGEVDPLYTYMSLSNKILAQSLKDGTPPQNYLGECLQMIERLPPAMRNSLKLRHQYIANGFYCDQSIENEKIDLIFKSGLFFSDIQIWSGA